ncbi:MAG: GYDIA family GHMP kinase [Saprospiraceae bacterium]|nr:GYDIA family GHMP kinase [Saprospiraceae bacterium]
MSEQHFFSKGKLLLTAEYAVLDGATALALPTKMGQSLDIKPVETNELAWTSIDANGKEWFSATFDFDTFKCKKTSNFDVAMMLEKIFAAAIHLKYDNSVAKNRGVRPPQYLTPFSAETRLTFPREWGLGTSSTLISNIAQVFHVNPYALLAATFGGSGYDIACANADSPILFKLDKGVPFSEKAAFTPTFSENLYFIYLGKKQNSREGIERYKNQQIAAKNNSNTKGGYLKEISDLTTAFLTARDLKTFEKLIEQHENIIAALVGLPRAKTLYFADYWGEIKSLGAWGGDFVLATSNRNDNDTKKYFNTKGFNTVLTYAEMML